MRIKKLITILLLSGLTAINMCSCDKNSKEITTSEVMEDNIEVVNENIVTGNRFVVLNDDSEIQMDEDGSFIYYRTKEEYDGDYYKGTYEAYHGQEAVDKVVSLEQYGITEEEIDRVIDSTIESGYRLGDVSGQNSMFYMLENYTGEKYSNAETYDVDKDVFYCIILHNDILYMDGKEEEIEHDTVYIGYYIEEVGMIDLLNIGTANSAVWILQ
ncbi:MAG: hypothetical protein IJA10_00185 [Lachnospiraceae bacterium]|nr:hypothetical protein [Lachnospiraceae bacterium]